MKTIREILTADQSNKYKKSIGSARLLLVLGKADVLDMPVQKFVETHKKFAFYKYRNLGPAMRNHLIDLLEQEGYCAWCGNKKSVD